MRVTFILSSLARCRTFGAVTLACAMLFAVGCAHAQDASTQSAGATTTTDSPPVRYDSDYADPAFHAGRRQALIDAMPDTALIVVLSAPERRRDNDVLYTYRQSSDLYYLSGTHESEAVLVLIPHGLQLDGESVQEILFTPERTAFSDEWLGRRFGVEGVQNILGIEKALPLSMFESILDYAAETAGGNVYVLWPEGGVEPGSTLGLQVASLHEIVGKDQDADFRRQRLRGTLDLMRSVKEPEELRLMQRAIDITAGALRAAYRAARPDMHEYELEAVIEYVFHSEGAEAPAFPSIVGSGENSVVLHYETNRRQMQDGDLVVMDVGAEYHGYAADVTRTIPVSGTFSDDQRAIYQLVLDAQEAAIEATRPGNSFNAPHYAARAVLEQGLRDLGILGEEEDVMRYAIHASSHYLGLSVHDVGPRAAPLQAGNVITVEPGLYFKPSPDVDPRWWNIGVRIEDDVLVTADGPEVLSADAPKSIEEIESLMAQSCDVSLCTAESRP